MKRREILHPLGMRTLLVGATLPGFLGGIPPNAPGQALRQKTTHHDRNCRNPRGCRSCVMVSFCLLASFSISAAQPPSATERIGPDGILGSLVICGGGTLPEEIRAKFVELAGGEETQLVVIPTANGRADRQNAGRVDGWIDDGLKSITVLHTRNRNTANRERFVAPLKTATAVWFEGGAQSRIADAYLGTAVERELNALLQRGGVIGGTSAGAAIMSRTMIARNNPVPDVQTGFQLLPGTIIDQHFLKRNRQPRLRRALHDHPGLFGLGIDENTALVVRGRRMRVFGDSTVTVMLSGGQGRSPREFQLESGQRADLTALRRAAQQRTLAPFPPSKTPAREVPSGALMIVGGGSIPQGIGRRFVELAGGSDRLIVVLPTAQADAAARRSKPPPFLQEAGATNIRVLPARTPAEINAPAFAEALTEAGGVWFNGGRQWRFIDAYERTRAVELFRAVLGRGGVIGGTSAGASIQAQYMVRGHPLGNTVMMAEGYERGLGFLAGTAIDQHFAQRDRFADMTSLKRTYPQLLGIGIDESTAIVVQKSRARVIGTNQVHFYDHDFDRIDRDGQDYISISAPQEFDLLRCEIVD